MRRRAQTARRGIFGSCAHRARCARLIWQVLMVSNVETVIVFRSCCPIVVACFDYVFYRRACPSFRSVCSLLLITGGAVGYIVNDKEFQTSGWVAYYWVMIWWVVLIFQLTYGKFLVRAAALPSARRSLAPVSRSGARRSRHRAHRCRASRSRASGRLCCTRTPSPCCPRCSSASPPAS